MKRAIAFLLALLLAAGLLACGGKEPPAEQPDRTPGAPAASAPSGGDGALTIAVVPKSLDNPVFLDAREACMGVAQELGVRLEWLAPMTADAAEQEAIVNSLIKRKVDGIVISCIDPDAMKGVIDRAVDAGIRVATFDSDSPGSKRLFYCGTDNYEAGKACGTALYNVLQKQNRQNDELRILVMTADSESYNLSERLRGFSEVIKNLGLSFAYVDILYCKDDINMAGELLEQAVKTRDFDVFFGVGGWPLLLPPESLPNFQKWCDAGGTSIVVDTFYPIIAAAKLGLADALVGQDFAKMGELSIRYLVRAIKGERISESFIDTGLEHADPDNYDLLLTTKKPWDFK